MKQITSNTVLIQEDKSYPAIQTEQGIVWVDNTFPSFNDWYYIPFTNAFEQYKENIKYGEFHPHKMLWNKIIAANFELEGVPKIELEDEAERLSLKVYPIDPFYDGDELRHSDTNDELREGWIKCYKANQAKYTEKDIIDLFATIGYLLPLNQLERKEYIKKHLQSLNSIKEIIIDKNFN